MTDYLNIILGGLGSIASIIGLTVAFIKDNNIRNKVFYSIIVLLTISTTVVSYKYKKAIDDKLNIQLRKAQMKADAKQLLRNLPATISYFQAGENEGVIYSTLTLLEANKDIFPDTYDLFKQNVIKRLEKVNSETESSKKSEQLELAGNSALQFLKSLSE
jgi:hypothetical protein